MKYSCIMERRLVTYAMSDTEVLKSIGLQIRQMRINAQLTQQQLSQRSGVPRSTITHIENGENVSFLSIIALLRGMNQLEVLNTFYAPATVSPIAIAKQKGRLVKRVRNATAISPVIQYKSEW